jgi:hypothetical protein
MSLLGPTRPSATSAWRGSYLGISRRPKGDAGAFLALFEQLIAGQWKML